MEHRRIPIEFVYERKFGEARTAIECAPVWQGRHTFPAILRGNGSDIHPISSGRFAVFSALLINFGVEVVSRGEIPGQIM